MLSIEVGGVIGLLQVLDHLLDPRALQLLEDRIEVAWWSEEGGGARAAATRKTIAARSETDRDRDRQGQTEAHR